LLALAAATGSVGLGGHVAGVEQGVHVLDLLGVVQRRVAVGPRTPHPLLVRRCRRLRDRHYDLRVLIEHINLSEDFVGRLADLALVVGVGDTAVRGLLGLGSLGTATVGLRNAASEAGRLVLLRVPLAQILVDCLMVLALVITVDPLGSVSIEFDAGSRRFLFNGLDGRYILHLLGVLFHRFLVDVPFDGTERILIAHINSSLLLGLGGVHQNLRFVPFDTQGRVYRRPSLLFRLSPSVCSLLLNQLGFHSLLRAMG